MPDLARRADRRVARSEFPVSLIVLVSIAVQAGLIAHVIKTGRKKIAKIHSMFRPVLITCAIRPA
jgi:hypothetical protein